MSELTRVPAYPKFKLSSDDRREFLADYLPHCEVIDAIEACKLECRDAKDQMFLDLAQSGRAEILVSSDQDLLALAGLASFLIEAPEVFRARIFDTR